jgi:hypothetical protein
MSIPLITAAVTKAFGALGAMGSGLQAALSVGTTLMGYQADRQMAKAENAAIAQANESAREQMVSNNDQLAKQADQAKAQATTKIVDIEREAKRRAATASVAAGEAGVTGLSVDALLADLYGQAGGMRDGVNQNLEAQSNEIARGYEENARSYKNTVQSRAKSPKPSLLGAGLRVFTGIADAYKDDLRVNPK